MKSKKKILIVGTGPSAFAFLNGIKNTKELDITVIDNSFINRNTTEDCTFKSKFVGGSRIPTYEKGLDKDALVSSHFGGFSNYWGGTFDNPNQKIFDKFSQLNIDINHYLMEVDNLIPKISSDNQGKKGSNLKKIDNLVDDSLIEKFEANNFETKGSTIAINKNIINSIGENEDTCAYCNGYIWSCREETIWNSKLYFNDLIEKGNIRYKENTEIISFVETGTEVECYIKENGKNDYLFFDKVILSSGPVSTTKILIRSNLFQKVTIPTSDLLQIPFLKFFKTKEKKHSFADLFSYKTILNHQIYQQIYFFSKSVLLLSQNTIRLNKIVSNFPKKLLSFSGGIFIYFDSSISSKIEYSKMENSLAIKEIEGSSSMKKKIVFQLRRDLFGLKILLLKFLSNEYMYGTSYHLGSQFPMEQLQSEKTSDRLGRVNKSRNVHIVDSSILPEVNIGPVTKLIMANSYRIASELFR